MPYPRYFLRSAGAHLNSRIAQCLCCLDGLRCFWVEHMVTRPGQGTPLAGLAICPARASGSVGKECVGVSAVLVGVQAPAHFGIKGRELMLSADPLDQDA